LMALFVVDKGLPDEKPKEKPSSERKSEGENGDGVTTPPARTVGDTTVPETNEVKEKIEEDTLEDEHQSKEKETPEKS
jgi:hypothetical protein